MSRNLPTLRVAAAIIVRDGRILVARRSGDVSGWEFPGGKLRDGETAEAACRREIREELGCELGTMWLFDTVEFDYPDFHLSMDCFVCTLPDGADPEAEVHDELRWVGRDELMGVDWLPADRGLALSIGSSWDHILTLEQI